RLPTRRSPGLPAGPTPWGRRCERDAVPLFATRRPSRVDPTAGRADRLGSAASADAAPKERTRMLVARSIVLFVLAALAEIGGSWLVWQGVREQRGLLWAGAWVVAGGRYGLDATPYTVSHY